MTINLVLGKTTQQIHVFLFLNYKILKGFVDGLVTCMIFIDLRKAFDTINHDILSNKLSIIGFSDHIVKQFQSYLSNRKFTVNLENSFSEVSSISCGVPQGSILGPLLFLILSIHFGEDKTKSILFASKRKIKKLQKLELIYIQIKQHSRVVYLGCILKETVWGVNC